MERTPYLDATARLSLEPLRDAIVPLFSTGDWQIVGVQTDCLEIIENHPRLFRSKRFGDPDYPDAVFDVLISIAKRDPANLRFVEKRIREARAEDGANVSSDPQPTKAKIIFTPTVFEVPDEDANRDLVSVMMPFGAAFNGVYDTIRDATLTNGYECKRGDDIWSNSVVVQDIFSLIYQSFIVVCDFTDRNANVFYEAGIAHTLGKHVIPITQSEQDVPFNLKHHRYVRYLNNTEGRRDLRTRLEERIGSLIAQRRKLPLW